MSFDTTMTDMILKAVKVNCKYYHDGCMVTGLRSTMEEHEERFLQENDCHDYDHDDGEDEPGCELDN